MAQTKCVDVFNQNKRKIQCISNEHDYLGNGQLFHDDKILKDKYAQWLLRSLEQAEIRANKEGWISEDDVLDSLDNLVQFEQDNEQDD